MKILVTGASGFVGRYVCKNLAAARHQVIAVVRSGGVAIEGADVELIVPELKELDSISDILATCDAVIHLAGRAHVLNDDSLDPLKEFRKINVGLTASFALSAAQSGVKRFIFVSSIGVNGNFTKNKPFTEDDTEAPHDLYAISKLEAENALKHIAAEFDMQYVIVRLIIKACGTRNSSSFWRLKGQAKFTKRLEFCRLPSGLCRVPRPS